MTTFQTVVYAILNGLSEFLPISSKAHNILIPYLVGWQAPSGALLGAMALGASSALFIYFRHDWASMISCFLQVLIYRKRPMTLDERLPIFLMVSTIPLVIVSYYFHGNFPDNEWRPLTVALSFAAMGLPLWFFDHMNRKIKGMFDWKWTDAILVGLIQSTAVLPGWDHLGTVLIATSFLNYKREPGLKYAYFAAAPVLIGRTFYLLRDINFHSPAPMLDLTWLSFAVAIVVSFLVSLLTLGGFQKHVLQKGFGQYIVYRWILAGIVCGVYWLRARG
jgi:undecaprenyl-diphosphatase